MAVSSADVRVIVERVCARPEVLDACARRDLGGVIKEVPVVWTDSKGSSLNAFHDGTQATMDLYRLVQRRRAA